MEIIVGNSAGFCYGVRRAVEGAKDVLKRAPHGVDCLGELVHNRMVVEELQAQGLRVIENIKEAHEQVVIRAHGTAKEVYEMARQKNLTLYDYTCPNVMKIHEIVQKAVSEGFFIFLFGSASHPETIATKSFCEQSSYVIEQTSQIEDAIKFLQNSNLSKVLVVAQTTFSMQEFEKGVQQIQTLLPKTYPLEVKNTICSATRQRQEEAKSLSEKVDMMVIIGGRHSSNTQKLFEVSQKACPQTVLIESAHELIDINFQNIQKIGVMAGASTPDQTINEVVDFLKNR